MISKRSKHWQAFRRSSPGKRFQDRYWRNRTAAQSRSLLSRFGLFALGAFSILFGLILFFIPGPGVLFVALGGALVAKESLNAARVFDWIELKCRAAIARFKSWRNRRDRGNHR
jgi:hypothetical protein